MTAGRQPGRADRGSRRFRRCRGRAAAGALLLALAGCGGAAAPDAEGPDPAGAQRAAEATAWFVDEAVARGLDFRYVSGHTGRHWMPEIMGGGAALFDMDGDGDLDAYLVQGGGLTVAAAERPPNRLYRNDGGGRFSDVTEESGAGDRGYGMGVAAGDVDGDGDGDLYVTNVGPNTLLINDGTGRFVDRTAEAGVGHAGWGASTVMVDYDRDGDLDLFVTNYVRFSAENEIDCANPQGRPDYCSPRAYDAPARDVLYRNAGDGTFADVTVDAGLGERFGNGLGAVAADFDGDGWPDLFVANDAMLNQLWVNVAATDRPAGRRFVDDALLRGCAADQEGLAKAGMGVTAADVDGDDDLDLLVGNLNRESDSCFRNDGAYFTDVTAALGLAATSRGFTRFGLGWVDFDLDGWLDLYEANGRVMVQGTPWSDDPYAEPNLLFRGSAGGRFEELLPRGGTRDPIVATSRAAAFGDVDGDGAVDVLVVNRDAPATLLMNRAAAGNWIAFRVLEAGGRDAEGAIVRATVGDRTVRRDVRAGYGYLASNEPLARFGLGPAGRVDAVRVTWVDGLERRFGPFEAGQIVTLRRE